MHLAMLLAFCKHGEDVIWNCNLMFGPCAGPLGVRGMEGTGNILNPPSDGFVLTRNSHMCPVKDFCSTLSQIS